LADQLRTKFKMGLELMNLGSLQEKFNFFQPAMLEVLEQLVNHESPSTEKPALDGYAQMLAVRFEDLGAETRLYPRPENGAQLKVSFRQNGMTPGKPLLLLCHYDTVWPIGTIDKQPFRIEGDKAFGPGVYDMKASHVMAEFALRGIIDLGVQLPRPIDVLFTSDEEIGSPTSRELIEEQARESEYVLVLEPPTAEGALKTARKGVGGYRLQVEGRAAHAGSQPELGVSAINELAHQIIYLQSLADPEQGTTINVGVVQGGTRSNVIAAHAEAEIDLRVWTPQEAERIDSALRGLQPAAPGVKVSIRGGINRPPMVRTEAAINLFRKVQQMGEGLGLDLQEGSTGGGSDGNFTAAIGVPTLDGLGAMGDGGHAVHEHILISHLPARTAILAAILLDP
jgi:glutamate carboxypeptidase